MEPARLHSSSHGKSSVRVPLETPGQVHEAEISTKPQNATTESDRYRDYVGCQVQESFEVREVTLVHVMRLCGDEVNIGVHSYHGPQSTKIEESDACRI
jgi:hypothetical protein